MFDDIGGKIKGLAVVASGIGIFFSIIIAIVMFVEEAIGLGFLYLIIGPLLSWLGSFGLYGFGHLIETVENIYTKMENEHTLSNLAIENKIYDDLWICGLCGKKIKSLLHIVLVVVTKNNFLHIHIKKDVPCTSFFNAYYSSERAEAISSFSFA